MTDVEFRCMVGDVEPQGGIPTLDDYTRAFAELDARARPQPSTAASEPRYFRESVDGQEVCFSCRQIPARFFPRLGHSYCETCLNDR